MSMPLNEFPQGEESRSVWEDATDPDLERPRTRSQRWHHRSTRTQVWLAKKRCQRGMLPVKLIEDKKIVFFFILVWICLDILELGTSWSAQCTLHPPFLHLWREPGQRRRWQWLHIFHIYVYMWWSTKIFIIMILILILWLKNVSAHLTLVGPLHIFCNASKYSERTKQIA